MLLRERGYATKHQLGRAYIFLTYLNHDGSLYYEEWDREQERPYALVRFLGANKIPPEPGEKIYKGLSPSNRPNVLHYEPIKDGRSWSQLEEGTTVIHVESMIKAKAVAKYLPYPVIGLNGVHSWSSAKKGISFQYADEPIDFSRFRNVILFDSDVRSNSRVAKTRESLMFKFKNMIGCKEVYYVDLPHTEKGEKQGPDDYLQANGNGPLNELIKDATEYKGGMYDALFQRMSNALFCTRSGAIVDKDDKVVRSAAKARDYYANINEKEINARTGAIKTVSGFTTWLEHQQRAEVVNPAYQYLGPEFINRDDGTYFNLYKPGGSTPNGDLEACKPVVEHLERMMDPEDVRRLRAYLKFLKFTDRKPTSFPVMYSDRRGVGKGYFGLLAIGLLGSINSRSGNSVTFATNFNAELEGKRVIVVNDFSVEGQNKARVMNNIKNFTGDDMIRIERKGVDAYEIEARGGLIVNSNSLEDVPNDGFEDRRIWYVDCHAVDTTEEYWTRMRGYLNDSSVMDSFAQWILEGDDIEFTSWRPPMDERRENAITDSMEPLEVGCYNALKIMREDGYVCCRLDTVRALLGATQGLPFLDNVSDQRLTATMKRGGIGWKRSSRKTYGKTGAQGPVWIVNEELFAAIENDGVAVMAEVARASVGKSKY